MRGHIDCCVIRSMKRATLKMIQEWKKERNRRKKKKQKKKKNWKRRRIKEERRKRTMAARSADLLFCFVRFLFCWFRTGGWGGSFLFFSRVSFFFPFSFSLLIDLVGKNADPLLFAFSFFLSFPSFSFLRRTCHSTCHWPHNGRSTLAFRAEIDFGFDCVPFKTHRTATETQRNSVKPGKTRPNLLNQRETQKSNGNPVQLGLPEKKTELKSGNTGGNYHHTSIWTFSYFNRETGGERNYSFVLFLFLLFIFRSILCLLFFIKPTSKWTRELQLSEGDRPLSINPRPLGPFSSSSSISFLYSSGSYLFSSILMLCWSSPRTATRSSAERGRRGLIGTRCEII